MNHFLLFSFLLIIWIVNCEKLLYISVDGKEENTCEKNSRCPFHKAIEIATSTEDHEITLYFAPGIYKIIRTYNNESIKFFNKTSLKMIGEYSKDGKEVIFTENLNEKKNFEIKEWILFESENFNWCDINIINIKFKDVATNILFWNYKWRMFRTNTVSVNIYAQQVIVNNISSTFIESSSSRLNFTFINVTFIDNCEMTRGNIEVFYIRLHNRKENISLEGKKIIFENCLYQNNRIGFLDSNLKENGRNFYFFINNQFIYNYPKFEIIKIEKFSKLHFKNNKITNNVNGIFHPLFKFTHQDSVDDVNEREVEFYKNVVMKNQMNEINAGIFYFFINDENKIEPIFSFNSTDDIFYDNYNKYNTGIIKFLSYSPILINFNNLNGSRNEFGDIQFQERQNGGFLFIKFKDDEKNQETMNKKSKIIINNCKFWQNEAVYGSALTVMSGKNVSFSYELSIIKSEFKSNVALLGGAVHISNYDNVIDDRNSIIISNSFFFHNFVMDNGYGGAIFIDNEYGESSLLINENTEFRSNYAYKQGGCLFIKNSLLSIENAHFFDNKLFENWNTEGGAIHYLNGKKASIKNSVFSQNTIGWGKIDSGNSKGGAIHMQNVEDIDIINSTFISNFATKGGGLFIENVKQMKIDDKTVIEKNMFLKFGGGIYLNQTIDTSGNILIQGLIQDNFFYDKTIVNIYGGGIFFIQKKNLKSQNIEISENTVKNNVPNNIQRNPQYIQSSSSEEENIIGSCYESKDSNGYIYTCDVDKLQFCDNYKNCQYSPTFNDEVKVKEIIEYKIFSKNNKDVIFETKELKTTFTYPSKKRIITDKFPIDIIFGDDKEHTVSTLIQINGGSSNGNGLIFFILFSFFILCVCLVCLPIIIFFSVRIYNQNQKNNYQKINSSEF